MEQGSKLTLAIWHCVGKVSAFPLNPFFLYVQFSATLSIVQPSYESANIERMEFIQLRFKYQLVELMIICASCCDSSGKLVALKLF